MTGDPAGEELPPGAFATGPFTVPGATDGEVTVVLEGQAGRSSVAVIVRNGTDGPISRVQVSGVARDGETLAATGDGRSSPGEIAPGGWAVVSVGFGVGALEDIAAPNFEFAVNYTAGPAERDIPLTVVELNETGRGLVGIAANESGQDVRFPYITAVCFDATGVVDIRTTIGDVNEIPAGGTTPFTVNLFDPLPCDAWVVMAESSPDS